jgi:hypothetical protein
MGTSDSDYITSDKFKFPHKQYEKKITDRIKFVKIIMW